jgi:hypothetical protein
VEVRDLLAYHLDDDVARRELRLHVEPVHAVAQRLRNRAPVVLGRRGRSVQGGQRERLLPSPKSVLVHRNHRQRADLLHDSVELHVRRQGGQPQLRAPLQRLFLPMLQTLHQLHAVFNNRRPVALRNPKPKMPHYQTGLKRRIVTPRFA